MARSLGVIRKISNLINEKCLLTLYYSLIYPHLTYCNIVWGSTYDSYLHSIYLLQKRFVRTATHSKRLDHSAPLFNRLKLFNIFQINTYQICTFIYKIKYIPNSIPKHFCNYFQTNSQIHNYNTRQATDLHAPFYHTTQGQFSLKFRGTTLWDKYSMGTQLSSLNTYKKKLKDVLANQ